MRPHNVAGWPSFRFADEITGSSAGRNSVALHIYRPLRAVAFPPCKPLRVVEEHNMRLGLRGGSQRAETAATEEEEHESAPPPVRATSDGNGDVPAAAESVEDKLRKHLVAVEASPADYIAHPEPGALRFRVCDAAVLARKPRGVASATAELLVTRRRNAWQRFYPLDLPLLLHDVLDTEEVFDEEGEMGQVRNMAVAGEAPSGAVTSVVSPWAWATQRVKFSDGCTGTARLLFAQESTGVIMWSLQRGAEEPIVERVHISDEFSTPNGTQVTILIIVGTNTSTNTNLHPNGHPGQNHMDVSHLRGTQVLGGVGTRGLCQALCVRHRFRHAFSLCRARLLPGTGAAHARRAAPPENYHGSGRSTNADPAALCRGGGVGGR